MVQLAIILTAGQYDATSNHTDSQSQHGATSTLTGIQCQYDATRNHIDTDNMVQLAIILTVKVSIVQLAIILSKSRSCN